MSKWNKPNAQPLTQEFIQNEERRKQMIIQAAKRRKDKEKKLLEQEQMKKKGEEEALIRHKQEKKDAYIKYLRNNMYDKYEEAKRIKKEASNQIKPASKWKKKSAEKQALQENDNQLQALDLEVNLENSNISEFKEQPKQNESKHQNTNNRKKLNEEFEKEWQFQIDVKDDLLSSKLLDSLDLDVGTLNRDYQMKELMKEKKKKTEPKQQQKQDEIMELRDLIGYESIVMTKNAKSNNLEQQKIQQKPVKPMTKKPQVDEVEVLNQIKHKKQAKIMQWAIQEEQQAQDLFSQCSSISRKKQPKALKELNEELKNKKVVNNNKKALETIKEVAREKIASRQRKNSLNQAPKQTIKPQVKSGRPTSKQKVVPRPNQSQDSKSIEKRAHATVTSNPTFPKNQQLRKESAKTATGFASDKNIARVKSTSQEKKERVPQQKVQTKLAPYKQQIPKYAPKPEAPKKIFGNLPPLPAVSKAENNSIATHDMQIDVESFIKQDLINLNEQEMQIQEELKLLHKNNKNTLQDVYSKYEIKNDYAHSAEITGDASKPKQLKYYHNEVDIEDSIQNLDNYLIRRDLQTKQQNRTIRQETEEESSKSLINPFSNSEELCNQILKLAKNVSRFEKKPNVDDPNGYNYMNRMKRNNSGNKVSQISRVTKDSKKQKQKEEEFLSESQQVSEIQNEPLHRPPFIFDASQISSNFRNKEEKVEKIHVNTKLLKGLLLDDD